MPPVSDVDEIIETEVCNRLIRLSCAKMVNSKSERGGAKLHRNLLILHLLRKARDEQKRFPMFTNESEWMKETATNPMMMLHTPNNTPLATYTASQYVNVVGDEDDDDEMDDDDDDRGGEHAATQLLDLSKSHESIYLNGGDVSNLTSQEHGDFDYSTLRLAPLQYTFTGPEMYGVSETMSTQQHHMYGEMASFSDLYFTGQMTSSSSESTTTNEQHMKKMEKEEEEEKEKEELDELIKQTLENDCTNDCSAISTDTSSFVFAPISESTTSDDEEASSCTSDDDDDNDDDDDENCEILKKYSLSSVNLSRRRRKRKISAQRLPSPCSAKKCCIEERQLTGLISVFNSGLTVVADQFLGGPAASTISTLQQTPKQINSFMHIACNPLIC